MFLFYIWMFVFLALVIEKTYSFSAVMSLNLCQNQLFVCVSLFLGSTEFHWVYLLKGVSET